MSRLGDPISDTVTFTYTDESAMKKWAIKPQDIRNMDADDLPLALLEIAHRMGQMRLQPKENANEPGKLLLFTGTCEKACKQALLEARMKYLKKFGGGYVEIFLTLLTYSRPKFATSLPFFLNQYPFIK